MLCCSVANVGWGVGSHAADARRSQQQLLHRGRCLVLRCAALLTHLDACATPEEMLSGAMFEAVFGAAVVEYTCLLPALVLVVHCASCSNAAVWL
jgi:hypothetical protein